MTPRALPTAPAIPVPDEAWGYDEDASGNLRLLRPRFPPGTAVGPGHYDPNFEATSMLRTGPSIDFAHVSERQQPRAQATEAAADDAPRRWPQPPEPPAAMPLAALRPRRSLAQQPEGPRAPPPPPPGPGEFEASAGIGTVRPVLDFPRAARYHVRQGAALPLPPLSRGALRTLHPAEAFRVRRAALARGARPRPFLADRAFDFWAVSDDGDGAPTIEDDGSAPRRAPIKRPEDDEGLIGAWTGKPEPPGLTKRSRHLWRSFCVADANGNGLVSKPELMEMLKAAGVSALLGGNAGLLDAWARGDENHDGSISWDEFKALHREMPKLGLAELWRGSTMI